MESGIYKLVAKHKNSNDVEIIHIKEFKGENRKYNVNISYIDKLTTYFENETQLINRLYKNGYIKTNDVELYIEYQYNGQPHFEEVLYKDNANLGRLKFKVDSESKIDQADSLFRSMVNRLLTKLIDEDKYYHLKQSRVVNKKIIEKIDEYLDSKLKGDRDFYYKILLGYLSNYKQLRDLIFFLEHYNDYEYNESLEDKYWERIKCNYTVSKKKTKVKLYPTPEKIKLETAIINKEIIDKNKKLDIEELDSYEPYSIFDEMDLDDILRLDKDDERLIKSGINLDEYDNYANKKR